MGLQIMPDDVGKQFVSRGGDIYVIIEALSDEEAAGTTWCQFDGGVYPVRASPLEYHCLLTFRRDGTWCAGQEDRRDLQQRLDPAGAPPPPPAGRRLRSVG